MGTGDVGAGNVFIKPRESDKPEDKVTVTVHENVTSNFALRYLVNFAKAAPLCGSVELGLGPDAPLLVKYELEKAENGHMQFYLAPKIEMRDPWVVRGVRCSRFSGALSFQSVGAMDFGGSY